MATSAAAHLTTASASSFDCWSLLIVAAILSRKGSCTATGSPANCAAISYGCHSVGCGTASQTPSATQSTTRSFAFRLHDAAIRLRLANSVIEAHEHAGDFKEPSTGRNKKPP